MTSRVAVGPIWSTRGDGDDFGCCPAGSGAHEKVFCGSGFDQYRADLDKDLVVGCEQELPGEGG